jgi:hypothetical protein
MAKRISVAEALTEFRAERADAERFIDYAAEQFPGAFYNEDGRPLLKMLRRAAKKADSGEPIARAFA